MRLKQAYTVGQRRTGTQRAFFFFFNVRVLSTLDRRKTLLLLGVSLKDLVLISKEESLF